MTIYSVRDWDRLFENNRTRELKKLDWVPIPNKQDGDGYTEVLSETDGAALFGAWIIMVQIASKCTPRGTLIREDRTPHTAQSLARMSRAPAGLLARAFPVLVRVGWLQSVPYEIPHPSAAIPHPSEIALTGREGNVQKGTNGTEATQVIDLVSLIADRVSVWYKRDSVPLTYEQQKCLVEISKRPSLEDEIRLLERFKKRTEYFPQSFNSLLTGWDTTVDRARNQPKKETSGNF